ncbi:GNAT family N-acetyltransferase [Novosphingobium mangrovi (ex Hu et al. 2023)]|uniref:GNAT family N-acetyltransferase n=1 Tax=Novosphingobium mangrovi (ex Hu et al. 2023) TaxID=2930094 RepID=A0ABT0AGL1_9SPHN|nr:GNAT family N-acetyltransferase [Novosphingobium mangrovi (ex Hu et al. 2023)]MCJ1962321.1 GNAT family N-acetyltransferase [Novosphingobium mangrovi (ex Hu et al. 2023)]
MFIRTERLFLRPGWPEDLEDIFEALNSDAVPRTLTVPGLPRSLGEVRALLEGERDQRLPQFMIYLRAPGGARLVGHIGLVAGERGEVELVYWIKGRFCGLGFAREAVRAMLDHARALGHHRIVAYEPLDSESDTRVLLAAGFEDSFRIEERFSAARGEAVAVRCYEAALEWRAMPPLGRVAYERSSAQPLSA